MSRPKVKHDKVLAGCRVTVEEYQEIADAAKVNSRTVAGEIRSRIFFNPIRTLNPPRSDTGESSFKK
jgi:hypothetical protein